MIKLSLFLLVLSFNILWKELTLSVIELAIVLLYAGEDGQGVDGGAGHAGSHAVLETKAIILSERPANLPIGVGTPSAACPPPPSPSASRWPACCRPPHHCGCPPPPSSWGEICSSGWRGRTQTLEEEF